MSLGQVDGSALPARLVDLAPEVLRSTRSVGDRFTWRIAIGDTVMSPVPDSPTCEWSFHFRSNGDRCRYFPRFFPRLVVDPIEVVEEERKDADHGPRYLIFDQTPWKTDVLGKMTCVK